jgi:folate-binding protein YgfZ
MGTMMYVPFRPQGVAHLPSRRLVSLTGKDASRLLQGLITNNIETLVSSNQSGFYAAFLNSHGRLLTDSFIYRIPGSAKETGHDGFWIEVEESLVNLLCQYLQRHKLRSEVVVRPIEESKYRIWVAWNDSPGVIQYSSDYDPSSDIVHLTDPRIPMFASRFIVPESLDPRTSSYSVFAELPEATGRDYKLRRCLWGLTEGHMAMSGGRSLPHEFNLDILNAIDFKKGCYIGQELTIRTQHQGVVRKRILPALIYPDNASPPLDMSYSTTNISVRGEEVEVGKKIKRVQSPNVDVKVSPRRRDDSAGNWVEGIGNVGLALCRLEMMTDIRINSDQDAKAFTKDAEFEFEPVEGSKLRLKVKAFIPKWLRERIGQRQVRDRDANG